MFFIDIDYNKRPQKAKYYIAKPNKQIIDHIYEKFDDSLSMKMSNIYELNFSIPYKIENDFGEEIENNHIELIREKMLIKMELGGQKEWFIVDEIEENGEDDNVFNVKSYSLGYELSHKMINSFKEEAESPQALLSAILEGTQWKIGTIDIKFEQMRRYFEADGSNALDCVIQISETFGAIIDWDTENRTISLLDIEKIGSFKGLTADYGKILNSVSKVRTTDELTTRLYVYGNEELSINRINPTGQSYLEDFSYFMYPFERDENGNVIRKSHYMSDELCHAILDHKALIDEKSEEIIEVRRRLLEKQSELVFEQSKLIQLNLEKTSILARLDTAKATENAQLISEITQELNEKQSEIDAQTPIVEMLSNEFRSLSIELDNLQYTLSSKNNYSQELLDELSLYVIEKEWKDERYIDEEELYLDSIDKFKEIREPKTVIDIGLENFLECIEEQYYWDKLIIGDMIKIRYPQMNIEYMARIIEINYDFGNGSIDITIANTKKIGDEFDQLMDRLYQSKNASSILQNNKYKWDRTPIIEDEVYKLINSEWDANKNKIIAGVNNSIEIGNRGIILTNPQLPDEIVIMQAGIIALSKDGGESWQTAIKPDGIIAERLIGNIIVGRNLVITNGNNSFTFDNDGFRVKANEFIIESSDSSSTFESFQSKIEQNANRIGLIVSEEDKIRGDSIVASINLEPESVKISGKNIDMIGTVTFESFDSDTRNLISGVINDVDGWKVEGKTTIDGANIETGTISASKIKTEELIVGDNIRMGSNAYISWNQVTNQPRIPQNASDVGAISENDGRLTYIGWNGIYSGTISGNNIIGGTITGVTVQSISGYNSLVIQGASLTSTDENTSSVLNITGSTVSLSSRGSTYITEIYQNDSEFSIRRRSGYVSCYIDFPSISFSGSVDFSRATVSGISSVAYANNAGFATNAGNSDRLEGFRANHFSISGHNHDGRYAMTNHNHDGRYALDPFGQNIGFYRDSSTGRIVVRVNGSNVGSLAWN